MNYTHRQTQELISGYAADLINAGFVLSSFGPGHTDGWTTSEIYLRDKWGNKATIEAHEDWNLDLENDIELNTLTISLTYECKDYSNIKEDLLTLYQVNRHGYHQDPYYTEDRQLAENCLKLHVKRYKDRNPQRAKPSPFDWAERLNSNPDAVRIMERAVCRKTGRKTPPKNVHIFSFHKSRKGNQMYISYAKGKGLDTIVLT